ncbi:MAG: YabP/YqfC family sporulation protein [Faecalibacterium sp.]|nr:YabP/YqfC family sporulation protein [Faecalibacterium sp.]
MPTTREAAQPSAGLPHHLILEDREKLTITGVTRVLSCDEATACMDTSKGRLTLIGRQLSVCELSLEKGEVRLSGRVDQLEYAETRESAGGFFRRLVR